MANGEYGEEAFTSAMWRLERALQHKDEMEKSVLAYRARETHAIESVGNLGDDCDRLVEVRWFFREIEAYPTEWALILGDLFHGLRSALDNAVWGLATQDSGPRPERASSIMFPVCTTPAAFDTAVASRLSSLSPGSVTRVRAAQPFATTPSGLDPAAHPLVLLHHLSRLDKHRDIHIVRPALAMFKIDFQREPPDLETWITDAAHLEDGLELGGVRFPRPPWRVELDVMPTLAHGEALAATEHTPEVLLADLLQALCTTTVHAVAVLDPRTAADW